MRTLCLSFVNVQGAPAVRGRSSRSIYLESSGTARDTRLMGTPEFAAPEQYDFGQSDARTDIYGLGVTLHVLLTGVLPGEAAAPRPFPGIISRCMQLDPRDRYSDVAELSRELSAIVRDHSLPCALLGRISRKYSSLRADWRTFLPVDFRSFHHTVGSVSLLSHSRSVRIGRLLYSLTASGSRHIRMLFSGFTPSSSRMNVRCTADETGKRS